MNATTDLVQGGLIGLADRARAQHNDHMKRLLFAEIGKSFDEYMTGERPFSMPLFERLTKREGD